MTGRKAAATEFPGMVSEQALRNQILVPSLGHISFRSVNPTPSDPTHRRAFGKVPNLINAPVHPEIKVNDEDVAHLQPEYMRRALYGSRGHKRVDGVAFNPQEHKLFIFSMPTFLERVSDAAEVKYAATNDFLLQEHILMRRRDALQERSRRHEAAVDGYREQWSALQWLQKAAQRPGYANYLEGDLRSTATDAWKGPITNMIEVVGQESGWSMGELQAAKEGLLRGLLYGSQRGRIGNWQVILQKTQLYVKSKGLVVKSRQSRIDAVLSKQKKTLERMYADSGFTPY